MHETFWTLLHDPAHWAFELFLMVLFDGVIGALVWPYVRTHWVHHIERDEREGRAPLNKATKRVLCTSRYAGIKSVDRTELR